MKRRTFLRRASGILAPLSFPSIVRGIDTLNVTGTAFVAGLTKPVAGAATTLDSFAGLVAWYKTPISGATDGNAISSWPDSKGSYNLSTAGTAPTYDTGILNAYDVTLWNGSTNRLEIGGSSTSSFPMTVVIVTRPETLSYATLIGSSGSGGFNFRLNESTGYLNLDNEAEAGIGTSTSAPTVNAWSVLMAVATSSTYAFWINGADAGSGSHSVSLTAGRTLAVGVSQSLGLWYYQGKIAEIGIYNQDRSSDASSIYSHLKSKYAL